MFSPRIQQLSAAKCQTIYAPVPPKEMVRAKSLDFIRTHRIISSVTADHVRDIRQLDHTTKIARPPRNSPDKPKTPNVKRQPVGANVSFLIAGGERDSAQTTDSMTIVGKLDGLSRAEVKFTPAPSSRGGSVKRRTPPTTRERGQSGETTSASSRSHFLPHTIESQSTPTIPEMATTPGRASPAVHSASPGPFYSPVRGTIRLSAHNRQVYTPSRYRQIIRPNSPKTTEHSSDPVYTFFPQDQRVSSPDIPSPRSEQEPNDPSLIVTGIIGANELVHISTGQEQLLNTDSSNNENKDGEEGEKPRGVKLPNAQRLRNNARMVINDAWMPRDSPSWAFRQKWLRLFARNGANGLAYAYSSKLQNAFT